MDNHKSYAQYLQQRSMFGGIYRKHMLYPRLSACLTGKVLDFGCGIGDFLAYRDGVVGVDINPHNVEYCRSLGLQADLIQDGQIPFHDSEFDSVVMDNVLEHIPQGAVDGALSEVLRILKPSGRILIGVPGLKGYASDDDHEYFYSEGDLIALMQQYGCRVLKSFHMPVHLLWLEKHISQYCVYVLFEKHGSL